jgi:hypothetical protein
MSLILEDFVEQFQSKYLLLRHSYLILSDALQMLLLMQELQLLELK